MYQKYRPQFCTPYLYPMKICWARRSLLLLFMGWTMAISLRMHDFVLHISFFSWKGFQAQKGVWSPVESNWSRLIAYVFISGFLGFGCVCVALCGVGWGFFMPPVISPVLVVCSPVKSILLNASQVTYCTLVLRQLNNSWKHLLPVS